MITTLEWLWCQSPFNWQVSAIGTWSLCLNKLTSPLHIPFRSHCRHQLAQTRWECASPRRYRSHSRFHIRNREWPDDRTSSARHPKHLECNQMRGGLSASEWHRQPFLLHQRQGIQCVRWCSGLSTCHSPIWETGSGWCLVIRQHLGWLRQQNSAWIRSHQRIRWLDKGEGIAQIGLCVCQEGQEQRHIGYLLLSKLDGR